MTSMRRDDVSMTSFQPHAPVGQQCSVCTVGVIYMQVYLHILVFNYRASVSGRMDVIYVLILLPYAEKFDPWRMTYVQLLSVTSV